MSEPDPSQDADVLREAIAAGDVDRVVALAAGWSEAHRTAVRTHVRAALVTPSGHLGMRLDRDHPDAHLAALLAVGTPTMIEAERSFAAALADDVVIELVRRRAPSFHAALSRRLDARAWSILQVLWRHGLADAGPELVTAMVGGLGSRRGPAQEDRFMYGLLDDPDVLDDLLWRMFDHEDALNAAATRTVWIQPDAAAGHERAEGRTVNEVIHALLRLAEDGRIDRRRLLAVLVSSLAQDFAPQPNRFLVRLHEALAPTPEQLGVHAAAYAHLLHHPQPLTVGLAIDVLSTLVREEHGPVGVDLCADLAGPLLHSQQNIAVGALRLLDHLARQDGSRLDALTTTVSALGHPRRDVQERALRILGRHWPDEPGDVAHLRAELLTWLDAVPASLQADLVTLSGLDPGAWPDQDDDAPLPDVLGEVQALAATLDEPAATSLTRGVAAVRAGGWPPPLALPPAGDHLLSPARRVSPVGDLDELVELLLHLFETDRWSVIAFERAIDGLSRLGGQSPPAALVHSLLRVTEERSSADRTAETGMGGAETGMGGADHGVQLAVAVRAWLGTRPPRHRRPAWWPRRRASLDLGWKTVCVTSRRLEHLAAKLHAGQHGPLLSLPTHEPAWIDADVLADRLTRPITDTVDLELALLRCVGDGRRLLEAMASLELGAEHRALVAPLDLPTPPTLRLAQLGERWHPYQGFAIDGVERLRDHLVEPVRLVAMQMSLPDHALHAFDSFAAAAVPTLPALADAAAARQLISREKAYRWMGDGGEELLAASLDPDRPMTPAGHVALVCALTASRQETRTLGTDVLLQAAGDGRLAPHELGRALGTLIDPLELPLGRLEQPLADAIAAGPLSRIAVDQTIDATIASFPTVPRSSHVLLEAWYEARAAGAAGDLSEGARRWLVEAAAGSSKRARAARRLLDATPPQATDHLAPAADALLARARRWAAAGRRSMSS